MICSYDVYFILELECLQRRATDLRCVLRHRLVQISLITSASFLVMSGDTVLQGVFPTFVVRHASSQALNCMTDLMSMFRFEL